MADVYIDSYNFGSMIINGNSYKKDLIIFSDRIVSDWRRNEGHSLDKQDLADVIKYKPEVLIVGKGTPGLMDIPVSTKRFLSENQIELIEGSTDSVWQIFNEEVRRGRKAAGVFHLTC